MYRLLSQNIELLGQLDSGSCSLYGSWAIRLHAEVWIFRENADFLVVFLLD